MRKVVINLMHAPKSRPDHAFTRDKHASRTHYTTQSIPVMLTHTMEREIARSLRDAYL